MYPIYFKDSTCVKCGGMINKLDINNNIISSNSDEDIRTARCSKCGSEYILKWDNENENYPIDKSNIEKFKKTFNN